MDIRPNDIVLVPMAVAKVEDGLVYFTETNALVSVVEQVKHQFKIEDKVQSKAGHVGIVIAVHPRWILVEAEGNGRPVVFQIDELTRILPESA